MGWKVVRLSGNIELILEATLPRSPSPTLRLSLCVSAPAPPDFRSGLVLGLDPALRRGLRASFSLPTGDGERLGDPFSGARNEVSTSDGVDIDATTSFSVVKGSDKLLPGAPSSCVSKRDPSGSIVVCIRGEDAVR